MIITIAFFSFSLYFISNLSDKSIGNKQDILYTLNETELTQVYKRDHILLDADQLYSVTDLHGHFTKQLIVQMIPLAILFCLSLIILSFFLWMILKHIQNKSNLHLVHQLSTLEENEYFNVDHSALTTAYENIRQKSRNHLEDYKRLHAYLSHEQKNTIAILRTQLEVSGNTQYFSSVDQLSNNIDDVLTLSEFTDHTETGIVDVALVCATVCDEYKKLTPNITFNFDPETSTEILAKERWIYRAITNLVNNAVKYGGGEPIVVHVQGKNNSVIVTVTDNGIGISKAEQKNIFQHRYRINALKQAGHGIGLSLVSHVCDLCGGFVTVESELNKGSTFYLSFPQS